MRIYKCLAAIALSVGAVQSAYSSPWPTAVADNITVNAGQRVYIPVLANDLGEGLSLTDVNARTVALGSVQMDSSRKALYYTSKAGFTGNDSFWYSFKDNLGRTNATQVFLKVISFGSNTNTNTNTNTNNSNTTSRDNFSGWPKAFVDNVTTTKNTAVNIAVLANDIGDRLSLTKVNDWTVSGGRASIQGDRVLYRPKTNYTGQDSFWYNFVDARGRKNSSQVKISVTNGSIGNTVNNGAGMGNASRISMHVDFLKNQPLLWGEATGTQNTWVARAAAAGSSQLTTNGGMTIVNNQLISYLSTNGQYYTVAVSRSSGNTIYLKTALPAPIGQWSRVWNFYRDGAHPNTFGFRSLTDFALRNNDISALNSGKHILLGDSWFTSAGIKERLTTRLRNAKIVNKGIGGSNSAALLERFDSDVGSQNPNVVWIIAGTNDYYQGVSVEKYKANMKKLIDKVTAIGAKAMVFDSSVAPSMSGSNALTEKSHQYAKALADLFNQ